MSESEVEQPQPIEYNFVEMRRLSDNEIVTVAQFPEGPVFDSDGGLANSKRVLDCFIELSTISNRINRVSLSDRGISYYREGSLWVLGLGGCLILSVNDAYVRGLKHVRHNYSTTLRTPPIAKQS